MYKNNKDRLTQSENQLRTSYDENIKHNVEIVVSQLDGIYNEVKNGTITENEGKIIAADIIRNAKYGENSYFWADTMEGVNVVLLGNEDAEGKSRINLEDKKGNKIIQNFISLVKDKGEGYSDYYFPKLGGDTPLPKRAYVKLFKPFGWIIGTGNYIDDIDTFVENERVVIGDQFKGAIILLISMLVISIVIGYISSFFMSKSFSTPIQKLLVAANSIADGDLNISLDINRVDELGALSKAFSTMSDNMNNVLSNINAASEQVASGAKQVSDSSMALSQGATEQASSTEQLTASIEEIASQTKQNAQNANEAKDITEMAKVMQLKVTYKCKRC